MKEITVEYKRGAAALALKLFGRTVADEELAAAVGAFDQAALSVRRKGRKLLVRVRHEYFKIQERHFFREQGGDLIVKNEALEKTETAPRDVAIRSFLRQVAGARALGARRIIALAAGSAEAPGLIGFYLLPRFGFNAPLTDDEIRFLPQRFAQARSLNELLLLGGKEWWKAHGYDRKVFFDLGENSSMMQVLKAYVAELQQQGRL